MAHAYTPGLKVLQETKVIKERRLPLKGNVLKKKGESVVPDDIVATTDLPGNVQMVNVANLLNIDAADIAEVMKVQTGNRFDKGDLIAETAGIFGLFKSKVPAPVSGTLESFSEITGQVVIREAPIPVEMDAYVSGKVKDTIPEEGVYIETHAAFIQGIFGIGGESRGDLKIITKSREEEITSDMLEASLAGKVVVGGSHISLATYKKAISLKIAAIVVGGFNYSDLKPILGYTLGVAITGSEDLVTSLIVTEGFGKINMGSRTFDLLKKHDGHFVSVNGATQIRAGVIRPEIVIPLKGEEIIGKHKDIDTSSGITDGSLIRVIRAPYFGKIGKVISLPNELQKMESETMVRVAEVEIGGKNFVVPRANLEMVETD
ncbi:MAG: hypothetical protein GWP19_13310 [Planctomycetia bacterium]|nr:hypothetical protein [Planctomycetia bacterium]